MLDRIKTILSGIGDGACATGVEWGFLTMPIV